MRLKICKNCGKSMDNSPNKTYCSINCLKEYLSKNQRGENNPAYVPKVKKKCLNCGKEIEVTPGRLAENRGNYCSQPCYWAHRSVRFSGKNNPRYSRVKLECPICHKTFEVSQCRAKKSNVICCSRECMGKYQSINRRGKAHPNFKKVIRICQECGKEFEETPSRIKDNRGLFCSLKCDNKNRETRYLGKNNPHWSEKVERICLNCGVKFEVKPSKVERGKGLLCSKKCQNEYKRGENAINWQGGKSFEPYCPKFNSEFRQRVRYFFNCKCFLCERTEEEIGRRLSVHHVNYEKEACCNDVPKLFVPLCQSCHSKTNKNRKFWNAYFEKRLKFHYNLKCFHSKEEFEKLRITKPSESSNLVN